LILIGALLVGGLAAFLTLGYVRGVEKRVDEDTELVKVVVAAAPIAKGEEASSAIVAKSLVLADRPRRNVPSNAVRRLTDVESQIAAIDLGGGEVVTSSMFGSAADLTGSRSAALEDGNVAITVAVDQASVSGDLIQPGDLVNILVRYKLAQAPAEDPAAATEDVTNEPLSSSGQGANLAKPASYVMQAVKVFAVGTDAGTAVAKEAPAEGEEGAATQAAPASAFITVQVPPDQAALLASVRDAEMYVTLVPPDYEPRPIPLVTSLPALPGELGQTPYPTESAPGE
jgi:Flp pilus assembly protein CpaB